MNIALRRRSSLHFLVYLPFLSPQTAKCNSSAFLRTLSSQPLATKRPRARRSDYEFSLISALKHCSSLQSIIGGQQLHCVILKMGLELNIFMHNTLISFYSKCGLISEAKAIYDSFAIPDRVSGNIMIAGFVKLGRLIDACKLFDGMPDKNCVSYTTILLGFAQKGLWNEAIRVFTDMRFSGVLLNDVTMASVISAYLHYGGRFRNGKMLHGMVLKLGVHVFVHVSTNLLHMYCLCACLEDAWMLFNEMPKKNVVSWNVMLNGYAKAGLVDLARALFEGIVDKDVVSWGTIIDCYVQMGRLVEALTLYREMLRAGLLPNDVMVVDIISACGQSTAFVEGKQVHDIAVKMGIDCYDFVQSAIIHFYAACREINLACLQFEVSSKDHLASWNALIAGLTRNGRIDDARLLFNEMPERDVFSWSSMISGYSQSNQPDLALELFHEMVAIGVKPNEITMVSVLSAIATLGVLREGRWAHDYIQKNSITLNNNLTAAIIDMYAKCGSIRDALDVFYQERNRVTDISPWNAIICGLAMHGHAEMSLKIFSDLQRCKIKPNSITFIGVLSACCHVGLVEIGEQYFKSMKNLYDIEPNIKHYGCVVDLLGRAGRLHEAEQLIRSMPMKADAVVWGTLLAACRTHANAEIGERAAQSLAKVEPSHGPSKVLLSNIYSNAGRWDEAFLVRRRMQIQNLTRSPAYSGVT